MRPAASSETTALRVIDPRLVGRYGDFRMDTRLRIGGVSAAAATPARAVADGFGDQRNAAMAQPSGFSSAGSEPS